MQRPDLAVVGGGVIGLSVAWRAAPAGLSVVVHERAPEPGRGTTRAAGGMLAPVAEADPQEPAMLALNLASATDDDGAAASGPPGAAENPTRSCRSPSSAVQSPSGRAIAAAQPNSMPSWPRSVTSFSRRT